MFFNSQFKNKVSFLKKCYVNGVGVPVVVQTIYKFYIFTNDVEDYKKLKHIKSINNKPISIKNTIIIPKIEKIIEGEFGDIRELRELEKEKEKFFNFGVGGKIEKIKKEYGIRLEDDIREFNMSYKLIPFENIIEIREGN